MEKYLHDLQILHESHFQRYSKFPAKRIQSSEKCVNIQVYVTN